MKSGLSNLESGLFKKGVIKRINNGDWRLLQKFSLVACGVKTSKDFKKYNKKIESIYRGYLRYKKKNFNRFSKKFTPILSKKGFNKKEIDLLIPAFIIHKYIHLNFAKKKLPKIRSVEYGLLTNILNNKEGNCSSYTALYTLLGLREKLKISILSSKIYSYAGLPQPHTKNRIRIRNKILDIDCVFSNPFDEFPEKEIGILSEHSVIYLPSIFYERLSYSYRDSKNYKKSIKSCNINIKLLAYDTIKTKDSISHNALAYSNRADVYRKIGNLKVAIKDYNKAIALDKKCPTNYLYRGYIKQTLKDYKGAIKDYNKAINLDPKDADNYWNRGNVKSDLKDYEGVIKDNSKAIKLNPKGADYYYDRANGELELKKIKRANKDYNKAIKLYTKAIKLKPKDGVYYCYRADSEVKLKQFKKAIKDYSKAIKLNPKDVDYYYSRGLAKEKLGDTKGAKRDYKIEKRLKNKKSA